MTFRAVVAAATGTTIEWYDFFLYGVAAALVFPAKFFPGEDPYVGTLLAFTTYFVGFAFLMAGVSTDYTEIMVLRGVTKSWRIALSLPLLTVPQILLLGWIMNMAG